MSDLSSRTTIEDTDAQSCPGHNLRTPESKFCSMLRMVHTFGLYPVYHASMGFVERTSYSMNRNHDLDLLASFHQWPGVLVRLDFLWKGSCAASVILLPVSLGLLQVGGVIDNDLARTSTLASCLFSSTGLITGGLCIWMKSNLFDSAEVRQKWMKASRDHETKESIDFWTCLALPTSSVAWSIIFCAITILVIAWTNWQSQSGAEPTNRSIIISGAFFTALLLGNIIQIYRVMKLLGLRWDTIMSIPDWRQEAWSFQN